MLAVALHTAGIPDLTKRSQNILPCVKIIINEDVVIIVLLTIGGIDSNSNIDVVILVIFTLRLVPSYYYGMAVHDMLLDPLQVIFILRLRGFTIPRLDNES